MFLKHQVFKGLINQAWKGSGLVVANMGKAWYLCGYSWLAWIDKQVMPNKTLAAIIELAGEMPEEGKAFKAGKNCPNQYELKETVIVDLYEKLEKAQEEMEETAVIIQKDFKNCRILQNRKTGSLKLINDTFIQLIDAEEIDEERESTPDGPYFNETEPYLMLWTNGNCAFGAYTLYDPEPPAAEALILSELEKMELPTIR